MRRFEKVLVTGGGGFVGSHCLIELLEAGYEVVVVDNLSNVVIGEDGHPVSLRRVEELTGKSVPFHNLDIRHHDELSAFFRENPIDCVIHCAALKKNAESVEMPLEFYDVNVSGSNTLLSAMMENGVNKFLFSGSCTVYGSQPSPLTEKSPVGLTCTTPYAWSKYMVELMLRDQCAAHSEWGGMSLRYFNPCGAHPSGKVGEDPRGIPNNLTPYMAKVTTPLIYKSKRDLHLIGLVPTGKLPYLRIFGTDYDTPDGTAVRDYIHVVDVARGHVKAIQKLEAGHTGFKVYNLGIGKGHSVLDVHKAFSQACQKDLPYKLCDRRVGDVPEAWCNAHLAEKELGWKPQFGIDKMCEDLWKFYVKNPNGYRKRGEEMEQT